MPPNTWGPNHVGDSPTNRPPSRRTPKAESACSDGAPWSSPVPPWADTDASLTARLRDTAGDVRAVHEPRPGRGTPSGREPALLRRIVLIAAAVVVFLLVSGLLARFLSAESAERDQDLALIQAEARGDVRGMLSQLSGCRESPSCVATVQANANNPRLRRAGVVKLLSVKSST